jgi:hypothetical protein
MTESNPYEMVSGQVLELDPHEYVAATLRGEHIHVPAHLKDDAVFRDAVETELVKLLNKQLVDEAIVVGSELPRSMVTEDKVHAAAVRELIHLEEAPADNFQHILRLVVTFRIRLDEIDIPEYLKNKLRPFVLNNEPLQEAA